MKKINDACTENRIYSHRRKILHVDMNNCYASIECLYRPELRDKPVAVAGSEELRNGIILAKNEIAKKYGVVTGETIRQAKEKCPGLTLCEPHFNRYIEMSRKARLIYERYTDRIEPFGIDECWLDVTCARRPIEEIAHEIRKAVKSELGITVSVGASFNKVFAKIGSDMKKPDAVTVISEDNFKEIVYPLPAEAMLYVGKKTKEKLNSKGIFTIGDLASIPQKILESWFGKSGTQLYRNANGSGDSFIELSDIGRQVKSVSNGWTAPHDLTDVFEIRALISAAAESVAWRMRKAGLCSYGIAVTVKSADFRIFSKQTRIPVRTDDSPDISRIAYRLFQELYDIKKYGAVRAITVCCFELCPQSEPEQLDIFSDENKRSRRKKINLTMDGIRKKYGYYAIMTAGASGSVRK